MTDPRRDIKAQLLRAIVLATEAARLWDQPRFMAAIGMPETWIVDAATDPDSHPLDEYVRVYDEAASQAGWRALAEIVRTATDLQRHGEWP